MPSGARATRRQLRAAAAIVVSAFFAIAAAVTVGAEPSEPRTITDAAFGPVTLLPAASAGAANITVPERTPDLSVIVDPWAVPTPAARPQPSLPTSKPVTVPLTTHRIGGAASWYCRAGSSPCSSSYPDGSGFDAYGAAGPRLRAALGSNWRGRVVYVDGVRVKLIDWCQCYQGASNEKLIDLYYDVFARTGGSVTIRW